MKTLIHWTLSTLAVVIAAYILPGITVKSFFVAVVVAVVLGFLNALVRPVLLILTFPITILTLGLFIFAINAFIVMLTSLLVPGFLVRNFWWALLFSLIFSLVSSVLQQEEDKESL